MFKYHWKCKIEQVREDEVVNINVERTFIRKSGAPGLSKEEVRFMADNDAREKARAFQAELLEKFPGTIVSTNLQREEEAFWGPKREILW